MIKRINRAEEFGGVFDTMNELENKNLQQYDKIIKSIVSEGKYMFREMRRFKQQVSLDECKEILKSEKRAAFSVIGDDGYPYTIPINFYYDEADNKIYFHGAKDGHKIDAIQKCNKVCLTTWNQGFKKEGCWEWNSTSVVVFGKVKLLSDTDIIEDRLRKLAIKYYPTIDEVEAEMNSAVNRVQMFAIEIEHMTGKLVNEK